MILNQVSRLSGSHRENRAAGHHSHDAVFSSLTAADSEDDHSASASSSQGSEDPEYIVMLEADSKHARTPLQVALRMGFLVWLGLGMLILVVGCGINPHTVDVVSALYILVQIITTVGYGDTQHLGARMRAFMALYIFVGNVLAALVITEHLQKMVGRTHDVLKLQTVGKMVEGVQSSRKGLKVEKQSRRSRFSDCIKKHERLLYAAAFYAGMLVLGLIYYSYFDFCECPKGWESSHGPCVQTLEACDEAKGNARSWVDALYMSVVTLTTVGFGDEHPYTWKGRLFGIFWMLAGVGSMANFLTELAHVLIVQSMDDMSKHGLSKEVFQLIDDDNSGTLTKFEFVAYMLVKYGMVSQEDLNMLTAEFDKFDKDGSGELSYEEIIGEKRQEVEEPSEKS